MGNIDYEKWEKEREERQKVLLQKFSWFANIIKEEVTNIIGDLPDLYINIESDDLKRGWWVTRISVGLKRQSAFDVNLDKDDKLVLFQPFSNTNLNHVGETLKTINLDSKSIFREYIQQMINQYLIPLVKTYYKAHAIDKMPEKLSKEVKKINLSIVTEEWFKNIFKSITEKEMNSEEAKKVKIENIDNGVRVNFKLDCGRRGEYKGNYVEINDRGEISISLYDTPVEGAIEHSLEKEILKELQK